MLTNYSKATVWVKCDNIFCNDQYTLGDRAYKLQCPKCRNSEFSVMQQGQHGGKKVTCRCGWTYNDFNNLCPKCGKHEALIIGFKPV